MIARETIDAINRSVKIFDIVSEKVELKRRGSNYLGLCPFHGERSPSFQVKADDNFYHCFGCGASGGAISFVMQMYGLSFPEAVELLAQKLGIVVKHAEGPVRPENREQKHEILAANEFALRFFTLNLKTAPSAVQQYLVGRNLDSELVDRFALGFAPLEWGGLPQYLKKMGVSDSVALASGLVKRNSKGELYGFYRGRLIFPIWDEAKKVIGFGGRVIPSLFSEDELSNQAKYLNSPETIVYQKSKVLYGLERALTEIRTNRLVYVVEGYLDVIAMNAGGLKNVVATCGTALTKDHLRRLSRLTNKVSLLFDGDSAGREAAAKCFPLLINTGIDAKAIFLPEGEDPHSIYSKHGTAMDQQIKLAETKSLLDCFVISAFKKEGVRKVSELEPAAKSRVAENVAQVLQTVEKPVEREQLVTQASFLLDLSPEVRTSLFSSKHTSSRENKTTALNIPASQTVAPQAPVATTVAAFPPELREQVAELERAVIRLVIVNRIDFPTLILADPRLCSVLSDNCLQFVESVKQIVSNADSDADEGKAQVRELIAERGPEFMRLWKQTGEMVKDRTIDFMKLFDECRASAQRLCIKRSLSEVALAIKMSDDNADKMRLIQQQMELARLARL